MVAWIEQVWQFCVEMVDYFDEDDDWRFGHDLLTYVVTVAFTIQKRHVSSSVTDKVHIINQMKLGITV
jgi:hypothetical protein